MGDRVREHHLFDAPRTVVSGRGDKVIHQEDRQCSGGHAAVFHPDEYYEAGAKRLLEHRAHEQLHLVGILIRTSSVSRI